MKSPSIATGFMAFTLAAVLPSRRDLDAIDFRVHRHPPSRAALASAYELELERLEPLESEPLELEQSELDDLVAFLHALTDESSLDLRDTVPMDGVPSGLPLYD